MVPKPGWPPRERYFQDYVPGSAEEFGPVSITEDEMLGFARRYDPQPFHADPAAARNGPFGGLIASGWHTAALTMRVLVDNYLSPASSLGSPGIDELRWVRPVRPGDSLRVRAMVLEARRSRSKPDRGLIRSRFEVVNQDGEIVMTLTAMNLMRCREAAASQVAPD